MALSAYDRKRFLDELNEPVQTSDGFVTPAQAKAKALANLGAASTAPATTAVAGVVKQSAAQANSTATDAAGIVTDFNALLAKLRTAGILAT